MHRLALRAIYRTDQLRFALFRLRWRRALHAPPGVSPNFRLTEWRIEPGARVELAPGAVTERRRGDRIWVQRGGTLRVGAGAWLRNEHAANRITVFPGALIEIGAGAFVNGAMLHAKREIRVGERAVLAFGVRILDADLHDLDASTPERVEPVRIGDRTWIGADALVLRGVTIGEDSVVAAGSIVTRDLPARVLAAGAPARVLREIDSREGCR